MRRFIISALVLSGMTANAQVKDGMIGINTDEPRATMHIEPGVSESKGLIIPRITAAQMKTMTNLAHFGADHHSMMTYLKEQMPTADRTGKLADVTEPGYYYYDNTTGVQKWKAFGGGEQDFKALPSSIPGLYNYITKGAGIGGNGTSLGTGFSNIGIGLTFTGFTNVSHLTGGGNLAMGNSVYYNNGGSMSGSLNIGVGQTIYWMLNGGNMQGNTNIAMGTNVYQFEKANAQFTGGNNISMGNNSFVLRNGDLAGGNNIGIGDLSYYVQNGDITSTAYNNIALGNSIYRLTKSTTSTFSGRNNIGIGTEVFSVVNGDFTGGYNIGMGHQALTVGVSGNLTGNNNIGIGQGALFTHTGDISGNNNIAIGSGALNASIPGHTGNYNIAIGYLALSNGLSTAVSEGNQNIGIGFSAGSDLISGNGNIHIGNTYMGTATAGQPDNIVAIGNGMSFANTQQDNVILLGNNTYNAPRIGMGTYQPQAKLDVNGGVRVGKETTCTTANEGTIIYDSTSKKFQGCDGTNWINLN